MDSASILAHNKGLKALALLAGTVRFASRPLAQRYKKTPFCLR
jgi:hypothetical protein